MPTANPEVDIYDAIVARVDTFTDATTAFHGQIPASIKPPWVKVHPVSFTPDDPFLGDTAPQKHMGEVVANVFYPKRGAGDRSGRVIAESFGKHFKLYQTGQIIFDRTYTVTAHDDQIDVTIGYWMWNV